MRCHPPGYDLAGFHMEAASIHTFLVIIIDSHYGWFVVLDLGDSQNLQLDTRLPMIQLQTEKGQSEQTSTRLSKR